MIKKIYLILNTFVDFNWLAPFILKCKKNDAVDLQILFIKRDLQKPDIKCDFNNYVDKMLTYPFLQDTDCLVFKDRNIFWKYFKNLKGIVFSSSPTLLALLRWKGRPWSQRWVAFSYFGEKNDVVVAADKIFVGSIADAYNLPEAKVELPLPYYDLFNYSTFKKLSNFRLKDYSDYKEIITIPYITESKKIWFDESCDYVLNNMADNKLFIFKYRLKDIGLKKKMDHYQNVFKNHKNVLFFDSPFFDLTVELMRISTKIFFTRKLTQFIKECFFSKAEIEVLHKNETIKFFHFMPQYNTIYDEFLEDRDKAKQFHIYDSSDNSGETLDIILNLSRHGRLKLFHDKAVSTLVPSLIRGKYSQHRCNSMNKKML